MIVGGTHYYLEAALGPPAASSQRQLCSATKEMRDTSQRSTEDAYKQLQR